MEGLGTTPGRMPCPGAGVFEEGKAGELFYVVGAVHAQARRRGQFGSGTYFGEIELLHSELRRTATVRPDDDTPFM